MEELAAALAEIGQAPRDGGVLNLIVRRPAAGEREVVERATLDVQGGLDGDNWKSRGTPNPECQITVMNSRAAAAVAGEREAWPLAGDQLYLDLDLSAENLPPGSQLRIGDAILEVTAFPHAGCAKFKARFGEAALQLVNSNEGMRLRLRGINARVIQAGEIRSGDLAVKLPAGR